MILRIMDKDCLASCQKSNRKIYILYLRMFVEDNGFYLTKAKDNKDAFSNKIEKKTKPNNKHLYLTLVKGGGKYWPPRVS